MPVPKRKHSKGRTRRKRHEKTQATRVVAVKTADKKAYKRPHFDESVDID